MVETCARRDVKSALCVSNDSITMPGYFGDDDECDDDGRRENVRVAVEHAVRGYRDDVRDDGSVGETVDVLCRLLSLERQFANDDAADDDVRGDVGRALRKMSDALERSIQTPSTTTTSGGVDDIGRARRNAEECEAACANAQKRGMDIDASVEAALETFESRIKMRGMERMKTRVLDVALVAARFRLEVAREAERSSTAVKVGDYSEACARTERVEALLKVWRNVDGRRDALREAIEKSTVEAKEEMLRESKRVATAWFAEARNLGGKIGRALAVEGRTPAEVSAMIDDALDGSKIRRAREVSIRLLGESGDAAFVDWFRQLRLEQLIGRDLVSTRLGDARRVTTTNDAKTLTSDMDVVLGYFVVNLAVIDMFPGVFDRAFVDEHFAQAMDILRGNILDAPLNESEQVVRHARAMSAAAKSYYGFACVPIEAAAETLRVASTTGKALA